MMVQTLGGRCLYRGESGIRVMDNGLYRWMMFESNAIQTLLFKAAPHTRGLRYIDALTFMAKALPGEICLLGLGGGAAAHALSRYLAEHKLSVVELNEEVIYVARQFFMMDMIANLNIIQAEAEAFVLNCQQHFDHLLIDLYDAYQYPDNCNKTGFFGQCQRILTDDGVLAINLANQLDHRPVYELIRDQFSGKTIVMPVTARENMVIAAYNGDKLQTLLDQFSEHKSIKKLSWDATWGCVAELKY